LKKKKVKIIDISHWQGTINWDKVEKSGVDVAIMKASQGTAMVDSKFAQNKKEARKEGLLCGFYHFANGSDYKKEADHFLKTIGDIQEGEFLVLDFEIDIANPVEWCKKWLDYVTEKVGFKPIFYSNEARIKTIDFTEIAKASYGLWIAKYGDNDAIAEPNEIPNTDEWKFYAIWQFSSRGSVDGITGNVDLNTTTMDIKTMKKYGKPKEVEMIDYKELFEEELSKNKTLEAQIAQCSLENQALVDKIEQIKKIVNS
jgi:lysozyme